MAHVSCGRERPGRGGVVAMAVLLLLLLLMVFCTIGEGSSTTQEDEESTIPPWLDVFGGTPNISLTVAFHGVAPIINNNNASNGNILLTLNQTSLQPHVFISGSSLDPYASYTLLCLDPDAYSPSNPILKNVIHWIISNIPGSPCDVTQTGHIVLHYLMPRRPIAFPSPYGVHRYYNLLFKQAHRHEIIQNITTPLPSHFDTRSFIKKYNLEYPVAGTIFRVNLDA